jgi:hypothetical protein
MTSMDLQYGALQLKAWHGTPILFVQLSAECECVRSFGRQVVDATFWLLFGKISSRSTWGRAARTHTCNSPCEVSGHHVEVRSRAQYGNVSPPILPLCFTSGERHSPKNVRSACEAC